MIYYRGLKFPHRAVVLLVLESDGACTGLNGHCARETEVLVLVWCYKARGDREQDLWRYRLPEGCIKQWCDKPSGCGCLSKECEQGEQWSVSRGSNEVWAGGAMECGQGEQWSVSRGSNETVTLLYLVSSPSCPTCRVKTQYLKHYVSHHWPVSPVTQQLGLWFLYCFSSPWTLLLLLTYVVASRIWSCHELDCMEYLPHTGFCYSKLLTYLCHDYSRFINNSGINLNGSELCQVSSFYPN